MTNSDAPEAKNTATPDSNNTVSVPMRTYRIAAGILTIYVAYTILLLFVLSASIDQSYRFLAGVMSGLGGPMMGVTIPLPALIIFIFLSVGGLLYCGKAGRGRFTIWIAALAIIPASAGEIYLLSYVPVPGVPSREPDFISLIIDVLISGYLVWVLLKTSQAEGSFKERLIHLLSLKNLVILTAITIGIIIWGNRGEISHEYNKSNWEPADQIAGLKLGMSSDQFGGVKGKFYGCGSAVCSWHFRTNKRPDLLVHLRDGKAVKIHTISPRVTGDTVPFENIEQMHEILGPEDIRSEGYAEIHYTYLKWNVTYEWSNDVLVGIVLGLDDWAYEVRNQYRYYVNGRQVCPSQACPWDDQKNLKQEYANASYRDFLSPTPELAAMLDNAENYENEKLRIEAETASLKTYLERAEQGEALAQSRLGGMYYRAGRDYGRAEDYLKAEKWIRLAAGQDYAEAQHTLGIMYEEGHGVTQDFAEAMKWYRLASDKRELHAMSRLGSMYMNGRGVNKDLIRAYKWFNLSSMGDSDALKYREELEKILTEEEKAQANEMAKAWYDDYMAKLKASRKQ